MQIGTRISLCSFDWATHCILTFTCTEYKQNHHKHSSYTNTLCPRNSPTACIGWMASYFLTWSSMQYFGWSLKAAIVVGISRVECRTSTLFPSISNCSLMRNGIALELHSNNCLTHHSSSTRYLMSLGKWSKYVRVTSVIKWLGGAPCSKAKHVSVRGCAIAAWIT